MLQIRTSEIDASTDPCLKNHFARVRVHRYTQLYMSEPSIELEIRGEIRPKDVTFLQKRLIALGFTHRSSTRRTSVMSFGTVSAAGRGWNQHKKDEVDTRCRITNGEAEVVTKVGLTSAHNRVEVSVPVSKEDLFRFAQLFGAMPFYTKVGSRRTENYTKGDITVSLVCSPSKLAYIEIERMTTRKKEQQDLLVLQALARDLGVLLWKSHMEYQTFCDQLTEQDDWSFQGTKADLKRLASEMRGIKSDRT